MQIYKEITSAKNGMQIPVFFSGRTMESRYNPERDSENLIKTINDKASFFLVLGIGSGSFINLLSQKYPEAEITGIEIFKDDINFLKQLPLIKQLEKNPLINFCSIEEIEEFLLQKYLPAKFGELKIIEQRAWINENSEYISEINSVLNKTIGIISADYSVQAHFGKIWTSNIINNSKLAEKFNSNTLYKTIIANNKKTALIVGAGPSLDRTFNLLNQNNRNDYYIFATDTAGQALIKREIIPDVIISIDAQSVSYNHFINSRISPQTIYAFDLCANSSAVKHICESHNKAIFFCSGHPLAAAINQSCNSPLPTFFSGAGTVTISALDIAVNTGFTEIFILGADFSYSKGKAYTSGTYLDTLYNYSSSKLKESEESFSKLMFRTELLQIDENKKTTSVLEAYKTSLEKYLLQKNIAFTNENNIYKLKCPPLQKELKTENNEFSLKPFMNKIKASDIYEAEILLLPYIAWLRNNDKYKNFEYNDLLKLALDTIVSYNI